MYERQLVIAACLVAHIVLLSLPYSRATIQAYSFSRCPKIRLQLLARVKKTPLLYRTANDPEDSRDL